MPYSNKRRRTYNSRRGRYVGSKVEYTKKRVPTVSTLNKKIKKIENEIELKYHDTGHYADIITATPALMYLMNGIDIGPSQTNRIGSEIQCTSLQIRGQLINLPANINGPISVRMILFWDRQSNGEVPLAYPLSPTQYSNSLLNTYVMNNPLFAPYMYENKDRFKVLWDKTYQINPSFMQEYETSGSGDPDPVTQSVVSDVYPKGIYINKRFKLNRKSKYNSTTNGDESIMTNSLWLAVFSSELENEPVITFGTRLYFKDA